MRCFTTGTDALIRAPVAWRSVVIGPGTRSIALGPTTNSMDTPGPEFRRFQRKSDTYRQAVGLTLCRIAILDARGRSPDVRSSRPPIVRPRGRGSLPRLPAVGDCVRRCAGLTLSANFARSVGPAVTRRDAPAQRTIPPRWGRSASVRPISGSTLLRPPKRVSRKRATARARYRSAILRTGTRARNGDRTHRCDLIACVSWRVSLHRLAFACCVPALLADVPW